MVIHMDRSKKRLVIYEVQMKGIAKRSQILLLLPLETLAVICLSALALRLLCSYAAADLSSTLLLPHLTLVLKSFIIMLVICQVCHLIITQVILSI